MTDSSKKPNDAAADTVNHRSRTYERPDFPYRCGRERLWSTPCGRGPNADGSCGGVSECRPTRQGDRWRCSRPLWAGGPCIHGPKPDGSCFTQRPPCRPDSSTIVKRRRAGMLAASGGVAVIIALFATTSGLFGFDRNLAIPGPLTAAHANLIDGQRCGLCHEGHERRGLVLAKALVEHHDLSQRCSQCHGFDGQSRRPHNMAPSDREIPSDIGCIGCHTEHKGADANISILPDAGCHGCHEPDVRFEHFSERESPQHPPFSDRFGGLARSSIRFDHTKHFDAHFKKPQLQEHRPESCMTCHQESRAGSGITIPSFEDGCAGCHEDQIRDQALLLLTWPEMETMRAPDIAAVDRCRIDQPIDPDNIEPVSFELPGLLEAFLMEVDPDDMGDYEGAYQKLGDLLASEGVRPLADLVRAKGGDPALLLSGLAPEIVASSACSWIANEEYEGFEPLAGGGWIAEAFGLSYRPVGHADFVLKGWLDFAGMIDDGEAARPFATDFKASLFDPKSGPGFCASCHIPPAEPGMIWTSELPSRQHTVFVHEPHLAVERAADAKPCITCHETATPSSDGRDYRKIGPETCQQCHNPKGAGEACSLCHRYHPVRLTNF